MKIAIHQPNFVPWYPYFYKMAMVDKFILLKYVQFEKNNYQNRFNIQDKWVTKPVKNGVELIAYKKYADCLPVFDLNKEWINIIKKTLSIDTEIIEEPIAFMQREYTNKTQRLIDLVKWAGGDVYVTNPDAKNKYLDEDLMNSHGISVEYCKVPRHLNKHTFEILMEFGINGSINNLPKRELYGAQCV